jgi:hypothetical protein
MMNDELKSECLSFIIHRSSFRVHLNRVSTGKEKEKVKQD